MRTWKFTNLRSKLHNAVCYMYNALRFVYDALRYMYIALHYIVFFAHRTSSDCTLFVFRTRCTEFQSWLCC